jgi:hypothetical protein
MLEIAETLAPPYVQSDEVGRNRPDISVSGHQGLYLFDIILEMWRKLLSVAKPPLHNGRRLVSGSV